MYFVIFLTVNIRPCLHHSNGEISVHPERRWSMALGSTKPTANQEWRFSAAAEQASGRMRRSLMTHSFPVFVAWSLCQPCWMQSEVLWDVVRHHALEAREVVANACGLRM